MGTAVNALSKKNKIAKKRVKIRIIEQRYLLLLLAPAVIWAIFFAYLPMAGLYMAFVNYQPSLGHFWSNLFRSEFIGMDWFSYFFSNGDFLIIMRNTLASTLLTLVVSFPVPIIIAIALNEIKSAMFKRTVQTVSYLPHFISWVIAANIIVTVLSSDGIVNKLLQWLHLSDASILFLQEGQYFWWIIAIGNTWKEMGYSAILYLAAISSINLELYEAARVDGAGRFKQIVYVTMPHLKPTIVILLILSLGGVLNAGFDQHYLLGNGLNQGYSDVLSTYSFRYGLQNSMFSYASAVGLFNSVIAFILVIIVNYTSKKLNNQSLF